jgi:hypothetical protein
MNQFVQRVANYIANEVIIKGLANSRSFQKFAVRSDSKIQELHKSGTDTFTNAFEELNKMQARESSTLAGNNSTASNSVKSGPPIPPKRGLSGFLQAFVKEIRGDLR